LHARADDLLCVQRAGVISHFGTTMNAELMSVRAEANARERIGLKRLASSPPRLLESASRACLGQSALQGDA
jgi:hypothetical protein